VVLRVYINGAQIDFNESSPSLDYTRAAFASGNHYLTLWGMTYLTADAPYAFDDLRVGNDSRKGTVTAVR
jgi:hypothetical protein